MELTVIASSSQGNAYVLHSHSEALLIEAGAPFAKALDAVGYDVARIKGCIVTHEHGDHASRVKDVLAYGVPVYASDGTVQALLPSLKGEYKPEPIPTDEAGEYAPLYLGNFEVYPFATRHDAAEPLGFYIWHPDTGGVLFATDTYYISPTFADLRTVIIECNYADDLLARNVQTSARGLTWSLAQRIRASHLSLDTCIGALRANDLSQVGNIVLIHVSSLNGDPPRFRDTVARSTGRPTFVATPGLSLNIDINPF